MSIPTDSKGIFFTVSFVPESHSAMASTKVSDFATLPRNNVLHLSRRFMNKLEAAGMQDTRALAAGGLLVS